MKSLAWRHPFVAKDWLDLASLYEEMTRAEPAFRHLVDIVNSVEASAVRGQLAATTSMHDLLVTDRPIPEPPLEVVRVSAPGSRYPAGAGIVTIEHLSHSGRNDRVECPVAEAVPLFWRFVREKFGWRADRRTRWPGEP